MTVLKLNPQIYKQKVQEGLENDLKKELKNPFAYPRLEKVVINTGIGRVKDGKQKEEIYQAFLKLSTQKPKRIVTKKSISGFKLRAGEVVGYQVTLRGDKMYDFLLNLVYASLPRGRDFKGVKADAFDNSLKTFSLGIPSVAVFPAIGFTGGLEFGVQVSLVFKHSTPNNKLIIKHLNIPLTK